MFKRKLFIYGTCNASFIETFHNKLWVLGHFHQLLCPNLFHRLMSIGWISKDSNSSTSWPSSWAATCSEYQTSNFFFKKAFAGLFTEITVHFHPSVQFGGSRQTSYVICNQQRDHFISDLAFEIMITRAHLLSPICSLISPT